MNQNLNPPEINFSVKKKNYLDFFLMILIFFLMFIVNPIYLTLVILFLYPVIKERHYVYLPFIFFIFLAIASRETGITFSDNVGDDAFEYFRRFNYLSEPGHYIANTFESYSKSIFNYEPVWYLLNYPATFFNLNIDEFRFYNYVLLFFGVALVLSKGGKHALGIAFVLVFFLVEAVYLFSHLFRQAWASIFLVLSVYSLSENKKNISYLYLILAIMSHMSAFPLALLMVIMSFFWGLSQRKLLIIYMLIIFTLVSAIISSVYLFSNILPKSRYLVLFDLSLLNSSDLFKMTFLLLISIGILYRVFIQCKQSNAVIIAMFMIVFFTLIFSFVLPSTAHRYLTLISLPVAFLIVTYFYSVLTGFSARILIATIAFIGFSRVALTDPGFFPLFFNGEFFSLQGLIFLWK